MSGVVARPDRECFNRPGERVGSSPEGGFTLLEFLVAATILALMAVAMFSTFRLALNSYKRSQESLDQKGRQRILEDLIRRQVGSLFPLRPTGDFVDQDAFANEGAIVDPNTGAPAFGVSQVPLFYGTNESMTFITVAPLLLLKNPGLTVVRYGLAEDEWGRHYFGELEFRYSGLDSFQRMVEIPRGKPYPMVEGVQDLRFEYYGFDASTQTYGWFEEWHGDEKYGVPSAVKIKADDKEFMVAVNASFFGGNFGSGLLRNLTRN